MNQVECLADGHSDGDCTTSIEGGDNLADTGNDILPLGLTGAALLLIGALILALLLSRRRVRT